jgi:DNA invertase Pin-like site-specific DNA recombinase
VSEALCPNNVSLGGNSWVSDTVVLAMGDQLGYARVSTDEQVADLQHDALQAAGCVKVFTDKASGSLDRRPQLDRLLDQLRPGDTVVVWRLDRLGRSLKHLIQIVEDLAEAGVGFKSLTEGMDTTTSGGKLIFSIFGALAEFERSLIRERTMAGLASARARGRVGGRPPVMTPDKVKVARQLYKAKELTVEEIAKTIGVSRKTVYRHLEQDAAR